MVKREAHSTRRVQVPLLPPLARRLKRRDVRNENLLTVQLGDGELRGVVRAQGGEDAALEGGVV